MHATIEQLLEIKDGIENQASAHVRECEQCQDELACLQQIAQAMYDTANQAPPAETWDRVLRTVEAQQSPLPEVPNELLMSGQQATPYPSTYAYPGRGSRWASLSTAVYTLAASILVTGMISLYTFNQQSVTQQQTDLLQAGIEELMINSRGLERVLQHVAVQGGALGEAERLAADRLYWRLQYVDQLIQENNVNSQLTPERIEALWNERIDALTELNQLYYQQDSSVLRNTKYEVTK